MKIGNRTYPDTPFERMVKVKVQDNSQGRFQFDDSYPYLEDGLWYKFNRAICAFLLRWIINIYLRLGLGLKIKGRENLKKYKKELENGAVTICNHVYLMDAVIVCRAVNKFRSMHIPMYSKHFNNPGFYWLMHSMGGVPVADTMSGLRKFDEAFDTFHERKEWIHVFPEEVRWDYYPYIRPFRKGAFTMAYKYDVPLVPCVITFRERHGLYRLTGKKDQPLFTINILEPVMPNSAGRRKDEVDRMRIEAHRKMVEKLGTEDIWPAIPEDEVKK